MPKGKLIDKPLTGNNLKSKLSLLHKKFSGHAAFCTWHMSFLKPVKQIENL
jgi:hypothetical protein